MAENNASGFSTYGTWPEPSKMTRVAFIAFAAAWDDARGIGSSRPCTTSVGTVTVWSDGLLYAPGHPEWGEVARRRRISEIPGDAQLEGSLAVGVRVALAQARLCQRRP